MINEKRLQRIDDILTRKQPTLQVMLDNVHSSQNLSAIIRSCDAVGVLDIYYATKKMKPYVSIRPLRRVHTDGHIVTVCMMHIKKHF